MLNHQMANTKQALEAIRGVPREELIPLWTLFRKALRVAELTQNETIIRLKLREVIKEEQRLRENFPTFHHAIQQEI